MSLPTRTQVLSLYKKLLRLGQVWEAKIPSQTKVEQDYIVSETKRLFNLNKGETNEKQIAEYVREAEARMTIAEHYRIPYPRPVNLPPRSFAPKEGKATGKAIKKLNQMSKPIYVKSIDDTVNQT